MKACIYEKRMQGTNGYDPKPVRGTDLLRTRMLIIAASEADAEYYALHDLGFVIVSMTSLVSDRIYSGPADDKGLNRWSLSKPGRKIHLKSCLTPKPEKCSATSYGRLCN